jgi:4-nitrophenyl phosphatase
LNDQSNNIYIHGSDNLFNFVNNISDVTTDIDESEMVLIGRKQKFTQLEVNKIVDAYNNGSKIYALNKDLTYPINELEFEEGNGAIVKEIERLLHIEIDSFGKPDNFYSNFLKNNFKNIAYVIGDRVDTDILLAKELNAKSYLVSSSIQNFLDEEIADFKFDKFSDCISSIIKNFEN